MTTTVSVGGITVGSPAVTDGDGARWVLSRIDGWHGGVSVRGEAVERPAGHGTFAERAWRDGRLVVIEGAVLCPSRAIAAHVQRRLAAVLADGTFGDLAVVDADDGTLTASVRLGAEPTVEWVRGSTTVRYQLPFYAPDPLRYAERVSGVTGFPVRSGGLRFPLYSDGAGANVGALDYGEVSATGRVELVNSGTADSWPQFEIQGPVPDEGFEIVTVGTGARLVFEGPVPAGSQLVLDAATGTAVIDGVADRGGRLTWRDWAPVPAGGSSQFAFIARGSSSPAVLTASVRPAFW